MCDADPVVRDLLGSDPEMRSLLEGEGTAGDEIADLYRSVLLGSDVTMARWMMWRRAQGARIAKRKKGRFFWKEAAQ